MFGSNVAPSSNEDAPIRDAKRNQACESTLDPSPDNSLSAKNLIEVIDGEKHQADHEGRTVVFLKNGG